MITDYIDVWLIWLIVAFVFVVIEMLNAGFGIVILSVGAVLASIAAAIGLPLVWQLLFFAVGSLLGFIFLRPVIMRWFDAKKRVKSNLEGLIGKTAIVLEDVTSFGGRVAVEGIDWRAVCEEGETIVKGTSVEILQQVGNTLTIKSK